MSEFACKWDVGSFSAVAVYTGENRLVRVRGSGVCPMAGYSVDLMAVNPGIVPQPERLHLGLKESAPEFAAEVLTDVPIEGFFEVAQEVTEVGIRGLGVIQVQEPA